MADNTAFETQGMSQALPQDANDAPAGSKEPAVAGWGKQQTDDYTSNEPIVVAQASEGTKPLYPWKEPEIGDIGPKIAAVEDELFGPEGERGGHGLDFAKYQDSPISSDYRLTCSRIAQISVNQEGEERVNPINSFAESKLHPAIVENTALAGYQVPTPIQKFVIPAVLSGKDVIGVAQTGLYPPPLASIISLMFLTGSGKTAAYLIPIMSMLMGKAKRWCAPRPPPTEEVVLEVNSVKAEPLVLIIVPTRELAVQIFNEARKFAYRSMFRPCVVYGGAPIKEQIEILAKGCDVLIGTPGRLKDFVNRPHILTLARLKYTIIDEADEMLGDDWSEELDPILRGGEQDEGNVKFCLFSATFPKAARDLAREYLSEQHVRIRVGRAGSTTSAIMQNIIQVDRNDRRKVLMEVLADLPGVRTMIFANSLQEVDNLDDFLFNSGLPVTSIHRDRSQREREAAIRAFRAGNAPIIVTTAVMARGIDVKNVQHVINYDLPSLDYGGIEEYTHRIGTLTFLVLLFT